MLGVAAISSLTEPTLSDSQKSTLRTLFADVPDIVNPLIGLPAPAQGLAATDSIKLYGDSGHDGEPE